MSDSTGAESRGRSFSSLPVEIQRHICAQLCMHCSGPDDGPTTFNWTVDDRDIKALAALSKTCRTLNAICRPMLYHGLRNDWRHFNRMVRTLAENPDLAACVKHYSQYIYPGQGGWSDDEGFAFWKQLARDSHMEDPDDLDYDNAQHGDVEMPKFCDEVLVALFSETVESMSLTVEDDANYEGTSFPYLARRCRHLNRPGFPQLRKLRFDTEERFGYTTDNKGVLVILHNAPKLEYLEFYGTKGPFLNRYDEHGVALAFSRVPDVFPALPLLRTLSFMDSAFDGTVCCGLVKYYAETSSKLECFRFVDQGAYLGENEDMQGMRLGLLEALVPWLDTLQNLTLDLAHASGSMYASGDDAECRRLLKTFTSLETLYIDEQVVCRHVPSASTPYPSTSNIDDHPDTCLVESLPAQLKTLTIKVFSQSHIWRDLETLGAAVTLGDFPQLRNIFIVPQCRVGYDRINIRDFERSAEAHLLKTRLHFEKTAVVLGLQNKRGESIG